MADRRDDDLIAMNSPSPQKPISRKKKGSSVITLNAEPSELHFSKQNLKL
jgi:hypothetical protein